MLVLSLIISITLLDQITKYLIRHYFYLGSSVPVISGVFNLSYTQNTGAAFGMLQGAGIFLIILSIVVLVLLVIYRRSIFGDGILYRIGIGFVAGGIIGNLIDRLCLGYVVDFLDFYWRTSHFPAFNVADASICIGVGLYIIKQIMIEKLAAQKSGNNK